MQKYAAPDPRFKALKQHKKNWNLAAKELIARLIAFKKALNGNASTKYSLPAGKLHQPVPQELISFLSALSSNYESVAEEALKIVREQNEFSASKVAPVSPTGNVPPKAASLKVEASSKLSRIWAYLKSPFLSDENKKLRISLLSSLASLEDMFKEFEEMILSGGDTSIVQATKEIAKIENRFHVLSNTYANLLKIEKPPMQSDNASPDGNEDIINKAQNTINDMMFAANIPGAENHRQGTTFDSLVVEFKNEQDPEKKQNLAKQIIAIHERLLVMANQLHKQNEPSFEKLFEFVKRKAATNQSDLLIIEANAITRWLKKKRHQAKFYDEVSASRIQIQEISVELRESLDELMNSLEKEMDLQEVKNSLQKVMSGITFIKFLMKPLQAMVKGTVIDRALDPATIENFFGKDTPAKKKERLQRKYNTDVDRQILNTLFK